MVEAVQMQDPDGPYHLFGYGYGAVLAFAMAHRLRDTGSRVCYLALTGSCVPSLNGKTDDWMRSLSRAFSRSGKRQLLPDPQASSVEISHAKALREFRTRPLSGPAVYSWGLVWRATTKQPGELVHRRRSSID